jgi:hypothetical protein
MSEREKWRREEVTVMARVSPEPPLASGYPERV